MSCQVAERERRPPPDPHDGVAGPGSETTGGDEAALDRLYSLDPGEFVAARDALARELRQAGRRELAAEVRRLRRPTLAAWAVDQLAHRQPERLDELLAAGDRLRQVQEEVLAGGDRAALHEAAEERRLLVARLTGDALNLLRERGSEEPDTHRGDVEATLSSAAVDPELAELLRRGRLARASPRPAGFGGLLDRPPQARGGAETDATAGQAAAEQTAAEVASLEQAARQAASAAEAARARAERADAEVRRLETELAHARRRAAEAAEDAMSKKTAAEASRRQADEAAARLRH